jgi:hypothetical protein
VSDHQHEHEPIVFLIDERDEPYHCAICNLSFAEGEKAAWIFAGDNQFVLAHDLCPANRERMEALLEGARDRGYCTCVADASGMPDTEEWGECRACKKLRAPKESGS